MDWIQEQGVRCVHTSAREEKANKEDVQERASLPMIIFVFPDVDIITETHEQAKRKKKRRRRTYHYTFM
jgi:hypothetical protein